MLRTLIAALALLVCMVPSMPSQADELSKKEIISLAEKKIKRSRSFDATMVPIFDRGNRQWRKEWEDRIKNYLVFSNEHPALTKKKYQAIYFVDRESIEQAGDMFLRPGVWVFIDKETGAVLHVEKRRK